MVPRATKRKKDAVPARKIDIVITVRLAILASWRV